MTKLRWWGTAIGAVTLLAMAVFLLSSDDVAPVREGPSNVSELQLESASNAVSSAQGATDEVESSESSVPLAGIDLEASDAVASATTVETLVDGAGGTDGTTSEPSIESTESGPTATAGTPSSTTTESAATTGSSSGLRLRIPSLSVDALVVDLGFNSAGQLDVPSDAGSVGWYTISTRPGENGNALLGGHLNWQGLRGVFDRLDELDDGDLIYLVQDGEEMVFRVSLSRSVSADAPLQDVLRAPAAGSTLTLFTCGGTFDRSAGEYDHRLVVNAVRIANGAG